MNDLTLSSDHVYRVGSRIVPSVTQTIGRAGLDPNKGFYTPSGATKGTQIHWMLEQYDHEVLPEGVNEEFSGYLKAYSNFCKFNKPIWDIDGIEQTFYNEEYDFAGTRDRVGSILWEGKRTPCCLDIKSGGKQGWHKIQLAGYSIDHRYEWQRFGLYVRENGTYELDHYTNGLDFEIFIQALLGETHGNI